VDPRWRYRLLIGGAIALALLVAILTGTGILPSTPVPSGGEEKHNKFGP
jgi:hypothetical protein